jgi:hypothetical protein
MSWGGAALLAAVGTTWGAMQVGVSRVAFDFPGEPLVIFVLLTPSILSLLSQLVYGAVAVVHLHSFSTVQLTPSKSSIC